MSAARLREAAELLRTRAETATNVTGAGDWWAYRGTGNDRLDGVRSSGGFVGPSLHRAHATYIAMMSPPVALALADWLDAEADCSEKAAQHRVDFPDQIMAEFTSEPAAFAVADAILGDHT